MKINSHMDWIHRLFEGAPQNSPKFSSSIHDSRCMILSLSGVPELCQSKACSRHTHFGKKCYALPLFNWVIVSWQARFEKSALSATNAHFELIQFHHSQSTFCRRIDWSWPPMPWFFFMSVWILNLFKTNLPTKFCQTTTYQLFWVFTW